MEGIVEVLNQLFAASVSVGAIIKAILMGLGGLSVGQKAASVVRKQ